MDKKIKQNLATESRIRTQIYLKKMGPDLQKVGGNEYTIDN